MLIVMVQRKLWLDNLRALAILLVVIGHQLSNEITFFQWTSAIKMPLFFVISGYLFNDRGGNASLFFQNLLKKLIVPWLALGVISVSPFLLSDFDKFLSYLKDIIIGKHIWFMPCLIIAEIILFFLYKIKNLSIFSAFCLLLALLGLTLANYGILDILMINTAFIAQSFLLIGVIIRRFEAILIKINLPKLLFLFTIYVCLVCFGVEFFPGQSIDVHLNRYFNIPLCFLLIFSGCLFVFLLFSKLNLSCKVFANIGQNSLVLYIFHSLPITALDRGLNLIGFYISNVWVNALVRTTFACIVCMTLAYILNRYFPFLVGKLKS